MHFDDLFIYCVIMCGFYVVLVSLVVVTEQELRSLRA